MATTASEHGAEPNARYERLVYVRSGRSGLRLPPVSLGCWHNFGQRPTPNARDIFLTAFDLGITHFDLANNYGPPPGTAEAFVGPILRELPRHELVVSTKAGYFMWPGPYGQGGSRKHLLTSLDESLHRLQMDHVDLFYHHCPDADTPLEETLQALDLAVRQGKALYVGLSNYDAAQSAAAVAMAREHGLAVPVVNQSRYNLLDRRPETALLPVVAAAGLGFVAFSPLAQGLLTRRYFDGIPADSRAARGGWDAATLTAAQVKPELLARVTALDAVAGNRGQTLAQMALAWVLREGGGVTSAVIGASSREQLLENCAALAHRAFSADELRLIDDIQPV